MSKSKPQIACPDPGGRMRKKIHELCDGVEGASVSDFVRCAVEDRLFEIEQAQRQVEAERNSRVRMACASTLQIA